jgi:translocation and assembly module TamB
MRKVLWTAGAVLVLAILGAALAVGWLTTSERAVVWLATELARASGGSLEITAPRGTLGGTVRIARLRYEDDDFRVTASEVEIEPELVAALARRAVIQRLAARELEIVVKPTPAKVPDSLALPVGVAVERLTIDRVAVRVEPDELVFTGLALAYEATPDRHAIRDARATTAFGALAASGSLGAARPFPASAVVSLTGADAKRPLRARATLGGTLERIAIAIDGEFAGAGLDGELGLAPFAPRWLEDARLRIADLELARLDAALPRARLAIEARAASRDDGAIAGTLSAKNAAPGALSDQRLPVVALASPFAWQGGALALPALAADLGAAGTASGKARVARAQATLDLAVKRLDLRGLYRTLRTTRLDGTVAASVTASTQELRAKLAQSGVRFELDGARQGDTFTVKRFVAAAGGGTLSGAGVVGLGGTRRFDAHATLAAFDPAAFGDYPSARITADLAASGALEPQWRGELRFEVRDSRWRAAPLDGRGHLAATAAAVRDADVALRIGASRLVVQGALGRPEDALAVSLVAPQLAELDPRLSGTATIKSTLRGALERPAVEVDATAERLGVPGGYRAASLVARGALSSDADPRVELDATLTGVSAGRFTLATSTAKAAGSFARHVVDLTAAGGDLDLAARLVGRWRKDQGWSGEVETLANRGRFPTRLLAPVALEIAPGRVAVGTADVELGEGRLHLERLRFERGRLATAGEFAGVAVARYLALAGAPPDVSSTLVVRGAWALDANPRLNGTLALARESGDLAFGDSPRLQLELTRLELNARAVDDVVTGTAGLEARQLGTANATFDIGRAPNAEPGTLSLDAPLAARASAAISSLRPLRVLAGETALFDGALRATLAASGTVRSPLVTGRLDGNGLALEVPQHGVRLVNGVLAATLDADALRVERFAIQGGEGRLVASGTAPRAGDTQLEWRAETLRLFGRPDRLLTVDGAGKLGIARGQLVLEGALAAREGYFEFARGRGAMLGDDVVVLGRAEKPAARGPRGRTPLRATLDLDLGPRFRVVGAGLDTGLAGKLHVDTRNNGEFVGKGEIGAVRGLYFFLGQRLEIERGRLIFDGPIANPALDVFALRRGLAIEPGVQLTGTLRNPHVELVSRPPLPEGEKLAWLVLGRGLDTASATDAILLQSAAASLLDDANAIPLGRRIALSMGLDDIGLKSAGGGTAQGQALTVGKRLSDRLYLTFEQGLQAARTIVSLEYLLGRGFRVRASGGQDSAFGVFYTRSWD